MTDGSAGDADYATIGTRYTTYRQPEPEFAAAIERALGDARTVLNVGAGGGSYEPRDREVTAVEPSATMRAQRPSDLAVAIDAVAENLPFPDGAFDAAMATFTIHQWPSLEAGLAEVRRVTTGPIALMTADPDAVRRFWLNDYLGDVFAVEARRYPSVERVRAALGGTVRAESLPIPLMCVDGFNEAYYGRPEMFLDPGARRANSAWSFVDAQAESDAVERLRADLESGAWDERYGSLRTQPHFEGSLLLVVARP
jgi:hypothetical protein